MVFFVSMISVIVFFNRNLELTFSAIPSEISTSLLCSEPSAIEENSACTFWFFLFICIYISIKSYGYNDS